MNTISHTEPTRAPGLKMALTHDPDEIICHEILLAAAKRIVNEADGGGFFRREFTEEYGDQVIKFDISCRLIYSYDGERITGVIFYHAWAYAYDEAGRELTTDFTEGELRDYILE